MRKNKSKTEFRKANANGNNGHPAYVYAKVGDDYKFIGITHAKITNGMNNIPLEKNPNPKDAKVAYMRPKTDKAKKSTFGARLESWRLSETDKPKAIEIIKKSKKK